MVVDLLATLAALHRVDHVAVGLEDFGRPDGYAARQLGAGAASGRAWALPELEPLAQESWRGWQRGLPPQRATSIVHGDYRIDNTLIAVGRSRRPRVAAVIDWELSTIGDPVADVAMMCAYRHAAVRPHHGRSQRLDERAAPVGRRPRGRLRGGRRSARWTDWDFHLALACFKVAVIAAGIEHRRRAGRRRGAGFRHGRGGRGALPGSGVRRLRVAADPADPRASN